MKGRRIGSLVLTLCVLGFVASGPAVFAQEAMAPAADEVTVLLTDESVAPAVAAEPAAPATKEAMMPPVDEALMARFKEYSTPNDNHQVMAALEGDWVVTTKSWMKPGSEPMVSEGKSSNLLILGGRFLKQKFSGTFMGEPFEGMNFMGYDNIKKEYDSFWIDNMSTGVSKTTAQYDPATKTFTEENVFSCPMTNGERKGSGKVTLIDNDHYLQEFFVADPDTGIKFKSMEISYSRAK